MNINVKFVSSHLHENKFTGSFFGLDYKFSQQTGPFIDIIAQQHQRRADVY